MRDIIFRGKRVDNGQWVYGFLIVNKDGTCYIKDTDYNVNNGRIDLIPEKVIPESVGLYTGFIDAGKAKIFEGDIIENDGTQYAVVWDEDEGMWDAVDDEGNNIALHELAQSRDTWIQ